MTMKDITARRAAMVADRNATPVVVDVDHLSPGERRKMAMDMGWNMSSAYVQGWVRG